VIKEAIVLLIIISNSGHAIERVEMQSMAACIENIVHMQEHKRIKHPTDWTPSIELSRKYENRTNFYCIYAAPTEAKQ